MVIMGTHSLPPDIASAQNNINSSSRYNTRQNSQHHLFHRPSSPPPPASIKQQQPQRRLSLTYNLDAEPNPFEQSFRVQSVHPSLDRENSASSSKSPPSSSHSRKHSASSISNNTNNNGQVNSPIKPVLPPLASITSPSDSSYAWSANLQNSLRSGPLSPAMLAGPQQLGPSTPSGQSANPNSVAALAASASSMHPPLFSFDASGSFRTGLTPSTGLTPLVGGPVAFPPPSPNTAAFLAMVNAGSGSAATITPNTLSALTGVLQQQSTATATNSTNGLPSQAQQQQQQPNSSPSSSNIASGAPPQSASAVSHQSGSVAPSSTYSNNHEGNQSYDAASATTHAANGLFLLSQAHQELTKREEAQRQGRTLTNGDANAHPPTAASSVTKAQAQDAKKGTKRKNETPAKAALNASKKTKTAAAPAAVAPPPPTPATRSSRRQSVAASSSNQEEIDEGDYDDEDDEDMEEPTSPTSASGPSAAQSGQSRKKPETEEEKRKNFLERNRQAALKCRQRKKQWLQQLQAKNEYLTNENERLTAALVSSREEIARLSQLVGAAGVGLNSHGQGVPSMGGQGGGGGPQTNGLALNHSGYMQHHPVSVPVSLGQGSASVVVPSNQSGTALVNGTSPPLSAASAKGMSVAAGVMGSPRSPVSGSEGRSSRGSYRDSNVHAQQAPPPSANAHSRSEYARDMRERELGHAGHAGMRQAVAVNGRGYGY